MCVACRPPDYPQYMSKSCWGSIDTHFPDVVAHLSLFVFIIKAAITWKQSVTYQCEYFVNNSSISECNHICETRNTELEIGTARCRQTRRNLQVEVNRSGFDQPRVSGTGCWTVLKPKQCLFLIQIPTTGRLPGPVDDSTLSQCMIC